MSVISRSIRFSNGTALCSTLMPVAASKSAACFWYIFSSVEPDWNTATILVPLRLAGAALAGAAVAAAAGAVGAAAAGAVVAAGAAAVVAAGLAAAAVGAGADVAAGAVVDEDEEVQAARMPS